MGAKQTDILINGGGAAGLALAAILGEAGLKISLIDPYAPAPLSETQISTRTVALMESSLNILKTTNIWQGIEPFCAPLEMMRIIDDSAHDQENIEIEFPASDIGKSCYGYNIPGSILRAALYERVSSMENVTLHVPASLRDYRTEGGQVRANLEDGTQIEARLIIGADGRNSLVRRIAQIKTKRHDYGQSAITCLINHSRSHNQTSTEFHRAGGPLALVPLPGNQSSVVWVQKTQRVEELMALKGSAFVQALQEEIGDKILGGITLEAAPQSWPLSCIKAKDLVAPRMALIAEAAHVISPITAQGLNLSLRDVAALAETIMDAARLGLDFGSQVILQKYSNRRRADVNIRVFGVDRLTRIVSDDFDFVKNVRRRGLRALDIVPPLKSFAMNHGLAPQSDLGRLAKGEAL